MLLVQDPESRRVFRLKNWRERASPGFLDRFSELKAELEAWAEPAVPPPIAAWVDVAGCPAVLGAFRQGVPLVDRVRSGSLVADEALSLLSGLDDTMRTAHERGLTHGSIVAGNVLCDGSMNAVLLDFGLSDAIGSTRAPGDRAAADNAGLEALKRIVEEFAGRRNARP